jgi:cyanate permease
MFIDWYTLLITIEQKSFKMISSYFLNLKAGWTGFLFSYPIFTFVFIYFGVVSGFFYSIFVFGPQIVSQPADLHDYKT